MEICRLGGRGICSNVYLLIENNTAILIDASISDEVIRILDARGISLSAVLLTHGHFDHTFALNDLYEKYCMTIAIDICDLPMLNDAYLSAHTFFYGSDLHFVPRKTADQLLCTEKMTDSLEIGPFSIKILNTPGHTDGSICYFINNHIFTGDTIFANGYGSTSFPGGSDEKMIRSLKMLSETIPDDAIIYPGHGDLAVFSDVKKSLF